MSSSNGGAQGHRGTGERAGKLRAWCVVVIAVLAACSLEEITIPLGEEVLVVQGIITLDPASSGQFIWVERSLTGTLDVPDQDSLRVASGPPLPVSQARVVVTRDDGDSVEFAEIPQREGVYGLNRITAISFFAPGRVYNLRVSTPAGRVVTGRMRMPDFPVVTGIPTDGSTFNRDRDTLAVSWSGGGPSKGVFVQVRPRDLARRLTLFFFTDSTSFRLPGNQGIPLFDDDKPPVVWIAGTRQTFTVAGIDSNLFNFTRSGNEPFTGSGFINTLDGALGVFGGVAPVNLTYEVVGDEDHPFEGRYRLDGSLAAGDTLGGDLRLFVTRDRPEPVLLSALVDNPIGVLVPEAEASGRVDAGVLRLVTMAEQQVGGTSQQRLVLQGTFNPDSVTTGLILEPEGRNAVGTFRLVRMP